MTLEEFKSSTKGARLVPLLTSASVIERMEEAARRGVPAVKAIDDDVADTVGSLDNVEKQHVGRWVRDALARRGWRPVKQLDWRGGRVFSSGKVYAPVAQQLPVTVSGSVLSAPGSRAARADQAVAILEASRDPTKPRDSVDAFLRERRAMWGEE